MISTIKRILLPVLALALVLSLAACAKTPAPAPTAEPTNEPAPTAAPTAEPSAEPEPSPEPSGRQPGERFEAVITIEGMEETVPYEHLINGALGFEMDYDYESFTRTAESDREVFVSVWDDPLRPENYLEVRRDPRSAEAAADAIGAVLSADYEISRSELTLEGAGECIRIDASEDKNGMMPDDLMAVYFIPAPDGCRVASAHYSIEAAEGFGRRFRCMADTIFVLPAQGDGRISGSRAVGAVRRYCIAANPDLESIEQAGEYPVYWELESEDADGIVVLFRSYTGAQTFYHVDPVSGETYVTELAPGADKEIRTDETLNVWDWSF
jgi:hypothetical protein